MMVGGNIKWHTRTITTAIALETSKGQFVMGIALGLILMVIAAMVNISFSFLRLLAAGIGRVLEKGDRRWSGSTSF